MPHRRSPSILPAAAYSAALALVAACAAGGAPFAPDPGRADEGPVKVKTPPPAKDGTGTTASCNGITQRGTCEDGVAVYCDLERAALRRTDCAAKGRECVVDSGRGAICRELSTPVTGRGFCSGDIAVFKDESGVPHAVDCSESNLACFEDACREGAYCCAVDGGEPPDASTTSAACQGYDLAGACVGGVATYCLGGQLQQDDCAAGGARCAEDECAFGAYCCGSSSAGGECDALGLEGRCEGNRVRYCDGGDIVEFDCEGADTCQVDSCYNGAACCPA